MCGAAAGRGLARVPAGRGLARAAPAPPQSKKIIYKPLYTVRAAVVY